MNLKNDSNISPNKNITNSIYICAEKYGEFCGNIASTFINLSSDMTANSIGILNASYKGFKSNSQPAINDFINKCQKALDNKSNN